MEPSEIPPQPQVLNPRILIGLACGLIMLLVLTVAFGIYLYQQGYTDATRASGASIAKMGYDRLN